MNKAKAQKIHARRRARERHGLSLSKADYEDICSQVDKAETLVRESLRISIKRLVWRDHELFFVYDNQRSTIVTFLKKEFLDLDGIAKDKAERRAQVEEELRFRKLNDWDLVRAQTKKI